MLKIQSLKINGFFSCCSVMLDNIVHFYNSNKMLPLQIDTSEIFGWYKKDGDNSDIRHDYFEDYNGIVLDILYKAIFRLFSKLESFRT